MIDEGIIQSTIFLSVPSSFCRHLDKQFTANVNKHVFA